MTALLRQNKKHIWLFHLQLQQAVCLDSVFRLSVAFTIFMRINVCTLSPLALIAYLQFWETNQVSAASMANHLSAIKAQLALFGLPIHTFADPRIKYFQKAMILHRPLKVTLKKIIDIQTLQLIVIACNFIYISQIFKAVYNIAYFFISKVIKSGPSFWSNYFHPSVTWPVLIFYLPLLVCKLLLSGPKHFNLEM